MQVSHHQIANHVSQNSVTQYPLITVSISDSSSKHRQVRLEERPPHVYPALMNRRKVQPTGLSRLHYVNWNNSPDTEICQTLKRLNTVEHPVGLSKRFAVARRRNRFLPCWPMMTSWNPFP